MVSSIIQRLLLLRAVLLFAALFCSLLNESVSFLYALRHLVACASCYQDIIMIWLKAYISTYWVNCPAGHVGPLVMLTVPQTMHIYGMVISTNTNSRCTNRHVKCAICDACTISALFNVN